MGKRVIVIGGGMGGLSAAVRLAAAGCEVTLLEKNPRIGGKLNLWDVPHPQRPADRPFRFDTGPSLLTMPFVFEQLFEAAGDRLADRLTLHRLDPIGRYVWGDGTTFELRNQANDLERELMKLADASDAAGYMRFATEGKRIWDLSAELFLFNAPEQLLNAKPATGQASDPLHKLRVAWGLLSTPFKIGMFRRFNVMVDRHVRSRKLRELLYQYATYSGASPFRAPATLAVIPHAERHFGGWYPAGGMYRLAAETAALAIRNGVEIRTSTPVERILVDSTRKRGKRLGQASGVRTATGEEIPADAVVCNADVVYSYRSLIDPAYRRKYSDTKLNRLEPGGAGLALLLGVEGTYPQLAHHTKFMPADYRSDVDAMFRTRTIPSDPCIYVCATTRTDPSQAPDGCENLFVLASAPPLDGRIDWTTAARTYRDRLVNTLEQKWGLKDLSKRIVVERHISPRDLQSLYNANAGSIYGISSNNLKDAFLRPPNRDADVDRLYFAGGASHPGGGLPLVTLSGKIVSELVLGDLAG